MGSWTIHGDPSRLVEYVTEKALKRLEEIYSEHEKEVTRIFGERSKRLVETIKRDLEESLRNLEYVFESSRSRLEIESRNRVYEAMSRMVSEAMKRAREEIVSVVRRDERVYEKMLRKTLETILRDIKSEEIVIETDSVGKRILEERIREILPGVRARILETDSVRAGVIVYPPSREVVYRYDIDTMISNVEEELKIVISKVLFGS